MSEDYQEADIFTWANNTQAIQDELEIELFLFNKKYTVYSVHYAQELAMQMRQLFINDLIHYILTGPDKGMVVRGFQEAEEEDQVVQRIPLGMVEHAGYVLAQIEKNRHELDQFNEADHDFRRIKGIVARCTHKSLEKAFYVCKTLPSSGVVKAKAAWMLDGNTFKPFAADAGLKISGDNQVLVLEKDIFVVNQSKFESMFGFNAKKQAIADAKMRQIEANFRLSFPEGVDFQTLIKDKKRTINKLQKLDPTAVKQEKLVDHADELGVELLLDEDGAIIIMNNKDLDTFVGLLNDDYVESAMTGNKYEIRGKKKLEESGEAEGAFLAA